MIRGKPQSIRFLFPASEKSEYTTHSLFPSPLSFRSSFGLCPLNHYLFAVTTQCLIATQIQFSTLLFSNPNLKLWATYPIRLQHQPQDPLVVIKLNMRSSSPHLTLRIPGTLARPKSMRTALSATSDGKNEDVASAADVTVEHA